MLDFSEVQSHIYNCAWKPDFLTSGQSLEQPSESFIAKALGV